MNVILNDWGVILVNGLNHETQDWPTANANLYISQPVKGAGLIHRSNGVHTIQIWTHKFTGNITFEATLDLNPECATFLPIPITNTVDGNSTTQLSYCNANVNTFFTATGQYAWIQANISNIQYGLIQTIKLAF